MGTTLTGKRVQNTYDALLKLSDNQNLTGTAKIVGDGYGNDSPIYLSTSQIGIGITPSYQFHTSGNAKIGGNLIISGNLTVNGTLTYLNVEDLAVEDPIIKLAKDNTANTLDIGLFGKYVATGTKYKGFFNDASDDKFKLFIGTTVEPTTTVDTSATGYTVGTLVANLEGNVTGGTISGTTGTFSADVTANHYFADTHFRSTDTSAALSTTGVGTVFLRPEGYNVITNQATLSGGTLTLHGVNPEIAFNGSSDTGVDMAIKATPEGLDFYEPEQANKVHFQILDDTGVNAPYGYRLNGTMVIDASRNLTNITTINSGRITITDSAIPIIFNESGHTGNGQWWRHVLDGGNMRFDVSLSGGSIFTTYDAVLKLNSDGSIIAGGQVTIPETPTADAHAASKKYVDDNIPTITTPALSAVLAAGNTSGSNNLIIQDDNELILGSGTDFKAYHNQTNTLFRINTGDLIFNSFVDDGDIKFQLDNGADPASLTEYMRLDGGEVKTIFSKSTRHNDSVKSLYGTNDDLEIYHDGTDAYIDNINGALSIRNYGDDKSIIFKTDNGIGGITEYFKIDGNINRNVITATTQIGDNTAFVFGAGAGRPFIKYDSTASQLFIDGESKFLDDLYVIGNQTIGNTSIAADRVLKIQTAAEYNTELQLRESTDNYGFTMQYNGTANQFNIIRHNNSAAGVNVISISRATNTVAFAGGITTQAISTFGGGITMGGQQINMVNGNIVNVNNLTFNDPGGGEGISWLSGNLWKIYESPNDLSNAAGNLQFVKDSTRSMTLDTSGNLYVSGALTSTGHINNGSLTVTSDTGIIIRTTTNAVGAKINFSDNFPNYSQQGTLYFAHADNTSIGSGAAFHFDTTETEVSVVSGDATSSGNFLSYSRASTAEVDFGFVADLNTGMYRPAEHSVGLVANGSRKLLVNSTGVQVNAGTLLVTSAGSAASPAIQVGDTNTGFYDAGSDVIGVSTGGVLQAIFGSPANSTPPLQIYGQGSTIGGSTIANSYLLVGTTSAGIGMDNNEIMSIGDHLYFGSSGSDKDIVFRTQGSTRQMRLLHSGELCLGLDNSSAAALLDVKTPAVADGGTLGANILQLVGTSETTPTSGVVTPTNGIIFKPAMPAGYGTDGYNTVLEQQSGGARVFYFRTSGAQHLSIDVEHGGVFGGYVATGDGTQSLNSDAPLTIRTGNSFAGFDLHSARTSGNIGGARWYSTSSSAIPEAQLLVETTGELNFYNGTNGAETRFTILSNGQVGIGEVAPADKLDVNGAILANNRVQIDGTDDAGNVTGSENSLRVTGYGIMGNRTGNIYITNGNSAAGASLVFGVRGVHNGNNKLVINENDSTFYTNITANNHIIKASGTADNIVMSEYDSTHYARFEANASGGVVKGVGGGGFMVRSYGDTYFNGGNFGIGDSVVTYPFTVQKSEAGLISRIYNTSTSGQGVLIRAGEVATETRILQAASRTDVKRFTVNSNGSVGVNVSGPGPNISFSVQNPSIGTASVSTTARIGGVGGNESSALELAESLTGGNMVYGFKLMNRGNIDNKFQITSHDNSTTGVNSFEIDRITGNVGIKGPSGSEALQVNGNIHLTNNSYISFNTSASSAHPKIVMDSAGTFMFRNTANLTGLQIDNGGNIELNNGVNESVLVKGGTMNFGVPGNGTNVNGRFCTIEGNTDASGEGSGRIFFAEHNSTTTFKESYGMSLGYRGGGTTLPSGFSGLTQIANGEWGMWGHNNSQNGTLIMSGSRSGLQLRLETTRVEMKAVSQRVKFSLWTGQVYGYGMQTGYTFGALDNNYALTSQMSNNDARGWWWGDDGHTNAQGAMSLNTTGRLTVATSVRLGYGEGDTTNVPSYALDVSGSIRATSDVIAFSDRRVKENIVTVDNALNKVAKLRGVNYTRKDIKDKSTKLGVIAQEVLEVLPEVVEKDHEGKYSVAYGNMAGLFIEAIKELKAEVDSLKQEIKELKNK